MPEQKKEKSLIDLAREHMDAAGADPNQGVDIPEQPAASPERTAQVQAPPPPKPEEVPVATDVFDGTVKDAVGDLLSNIKDAGDWRTLELPSRGKAYVESNGFVQIRPFTYKEEKRLRSIKKTSQATKVIRQLVTDCVEGLDYDSMTLEDKNYILFKLRQISYGDDYTITSPCQHCEADNQLIVEISKVPVNYAPDDYHEPFLITLPDSEQPVAFITPRCNDEHLINDFGDITENLWRWCISVGKYKDERIKQEFFKQTTVRDIAFFREELLKSRYGMKNEVVFECQSCGEDNESALPFNENFFSVS